VKIHSPSRFVRLLDASMRARGVLGKFDVSPCVYGDRITDPQHQSSMHPAFLKEARYSYQNEVRLAWLPTKPTEVVAVDFVDIVCPELAECCCAVEVA
jgi:hypothetical protein